MRIYILGALVALGAWRGMELIHLSLSDAMDNATKSACTHRRERIATDADAAVYEEMCGPYTVEINGTTYTTGD